MPRSDSTFAASRPSKRGEAVGNRVRVKVVKNKVAAPFRQAEFDIEYGTGISREGGLLDFGIEQNLVQKSGSFFSYGETRLGQGRNNAKQFLADNPEIARELEEKVRAAIGIGGDAPEPQAEVDAPAAEAKAARSPMRESQYLPPEVSERYGLAMTPSFGEPQVAVAIVFAVLALALVAVFVLVALQSRKEIPLERVREVAYRIRPVWFRAPHRHPRRRGDQLVVPPAVRERRPTGGRK